ncbi:MAG TPA: imidazolonepropionase [Nitrososphaerales archaeon]|nr:imidazolonepropionase [Nitrososphaerales archaeon]
MHDLALVNAGELVTCNGSGNADEDRLGVIRDGALVVDDGRVVWVGTTKELHRKAFGKVRRMIDVQHDLLTPGFVDPHTHLVFAGSREDELERKVKGESYTSILASGGGIIRTLRDTRKASASRIAQESQARLTQLVRNGVTTVEVKTGYGQRLADEMKLLGVVSRLRRAGRVELVPTFLGLHATPPEFKKSSEYVDYTIREMLPAVAKARVKPMFSDCFCEKGVFSREECEKYLRASRELGLACKIHADEFSDSGGASLAAEAGCVSADHLGKSDAPGIRAMADRGVTAVLLPGTSLISGIGYAKGPEILAEGCSVALGTDASPNSWIESPQFVMSLACNGMKLTPAQALLGFTRSAAHAIARDDLGFIGIGSAGDFVIHSLPGYRFLPYRVGGQYVKKVFKGGIEIFSAGES